MITVDIIDKKTWDDTLAEVMHLRVFGSILKPEQDRIDFALLAYDDERNKPIGYATVHEIHEDGAYMKFGGGLPEFRNSLIMVRAYKKFLEILKSRYKYITTKIENTNTPMLKLAISEGLLIVGASTFGGKIMLEHLLEGEKQDG